MSLYKISVVVPVYNASRYLDECIRSIQEQSFKNFEIILVNDGSTDGSDIKIDSYARAFENITVFHQKNKGVSAARNVGIKNASGKYIAFIDADDTIEKDYLKQLYADMSDNGLSACLLEDDINYNKVSLTKAEAQISVLSVKGMKGFPFCKLFDRNLLIEKNIFFHEDIAICEDLLFTEEYINNTNGLIVLKCACGYNYRKNPTSAINGRFTSEYFKKKYLTEYEALCRIEKSLIKENSVYRAWELRKAKAAVTCLRTMIAVNYHDPGFYKKLHYEAKKYWWRYIKADQGAISSKISIALSAFSPRLEFFVWRLLKEVAMIKKWNM